MRLPMHRLFPSLLLAAALAAQTSAQPALNRFVPADSCLVARIAAPAKWQKVFARTQVGKLIDGPTLAPVWEKARQGLTSAMDRMRQSGEFDADLLQRFLDQYAGDYVVSLQVDWDDLGASMMEDRPPAFSLVVALTPDGAFDLAALSTAIETAVEKSEARRKPLRDLTVGDLRLRITADDGPMQGSLPAMVDGHLVMLLGADLEKSAGRLLAADKRYDGSLADKPFFLHAQLDQVVPKFMAALDEQVGAMMPFDLVQMLTDLGLGSLAGLSVSIDAIDKQMGTEFELSFAGDPGYFGMFLVDKQPTMLRFVPANANWFSVSQMDINVLYGVVAKVWGQLAGQVPMSLEDAEAAFAESSKVRLKEDLLAHLGTELLTLQAEAPEAELDEDDPFAALGGSCFAMALRDGKTFGQSLETALRSHGLHAARKTEDYGDAKIHRLRLAGLFELEYAVTDDMVLITPGKNEGASQNLRAILDARKAGADASRPAVLQKVLADLPAGWTGVSVAPFDGMARTLMNYVELAASQADDEDSSAMLEEVLSTVRGLLEDAKRLGLEHAVGTTYTTSKSLLVRMRL